MNEITCLQPDSLASFRHAMSKVSKKRACHAVGHDISAAECGENRHSRYTCPASCPHNLFAPANYSHFLELEGELDHKCLGRLIEHAPDRVAMEKGLQQARHAPSPHALHAFCVWNLFFAPQRDGLTCVQHWEKSGFVGLKNDERVLLRAKMQTRMALAEIHRVLNGEQVEAVDLLSLNSQPIVFQDRGLASMAVRFASCLSWIYPLPHYWRLIGTAAVVPDMGQFTHGEIVTEIVRHLGGPVTEPELRRWLAEHFVQFDDALMATARMRRMQMFAGLDAKYGKVVYELRAPFAECRERLDASSDVAPDNLSDAERKEGFAEARVWLAETPALMQGMAPDGRALLGRVLLGQAHWRLEAMGAERTSQLRRQFEQALSDRVRFTGERLDDLGASLAAKQPKVNEALVPPRLLEEPQRLLFSTSRVDAPPPDAPREQTEAEFMIAADRAFPDDHIPALDGKTPRSAARDPALRPKLIQLLKQRVRTHDERNLRTGRTDDINWLLRELGADEIIFDPPPWRPQLPADLAGPDDVLEGGNFEEGEIEVDPSLPPAPPLPATPFNLEEAGKRLDAAMEKFETAGQAEAELEASGSTLLDDADQLTADILRDKEFSFAVPFLLQVWFALVPPGHRAPSMDYLAMEDTFKLNLQRVSDALKSRSVNTLMRFFGDSPQPALMQLLTGVMLESAAKAPKVIRPSMESQPVLLALMKTVVEELDRALRRRSIHGR